ncbi:MAG TPA: NUDIX hydrolase [Cytophagales bacterium]|nr:NUDIX hydrolase [Cytophagales bacterium]HAA23291.1 NUDIX hydrolase [Cytophagales bacterium]
MQLVDTLATLKAYQPSHAEDAQFQKDMIAFVEKYPEDFHCRTTLEGHLTASAWIVNPARTKYLLTHHAKLNRWLQLGGHIEEDVDLQAAALREALEESGLSSVRLVSDAVFDLDIHTIPARKQDPEHLHLDVRFLIEADDQEAWQVSEESHALAWVSAAQIREEVAELSMLRMLGKTPDSPT